MSEGTVINVPENGTDANESESITDLPQFPVDDTGNQDVEKTETQQHADKTVIDNVEEPKTEEHVDGSTKESTNQSIEKTTTTHQIDETTNETKALLDESPDDENRINSNGNERKESHASVKTTENGTTIHQMMLHCEKVPASLLASAFGSVTTIKSIGKKQTVNCRTVLWFLTFFGFMINYMFRININIAIVEMVATRKVSSVSHVSECIVESMVNSTILSSTAAVHPVDPDESMHFAWNELDQSRVLGSFFWLHWVLQVAGGLLAPRFGTKLIFGAANFCACILCLFIPLAARYDVNCLIGLRSIQGLISGLSWPAMHHLTAQWIPPDERSKFLTSYLGSSISIAVFYPIFGYVMSMYSWESVFYLSAFFGTCWYAAWLYFVYDSPAQHPRIDPMERLYIEQSLQDSLHEKDKKRKVPWKHILTSRAVIVNIIGQFGGIWGLFTMMTQAPTYFRVILGWSVQMTGLLSGIPHLTRMIFAYFFSTFADSLLRSKRMSRTNVRKLAGATSTLLNGVFVLCLAFSGCSSNAAILFLTLSTAVHGAVSSGQLASLIDISPNYSGVTLGLNGMIAVWPGFISPYIVGKLTLGNQTIQQWQYIFFIAAAILFVSGTIYVLFADSTLQSWNQPGCMDDDEECEKKSKPNDNISNHFTDLEKSTKLENVKE